MIVIGLGSGRSGTASLAHLLNSQEDAICFHEMNPSCVRFHGTLKPILNTLDEFQSILDGNDPSMLTVDLGREINVATYESLCRKKNVRLIGDIAFYYLSYVEMMIEHQKNVRFICLKREKHKTVESWEKKSQIVRWPSKRLADRIGSLITREPYYESRNFWMEHDGTVWQPDPVWDKCFPKFSASDKRSAIEQYWDYYYEEAEKLERNHPEVFRIVDTKNLGDPEFQSDILAFCDVPHDRRVFVEAHKHKSLA